MSDRFNSRTAAAPVSPAAPAASEARSGKKVVVPMRAQELAERIKESIQNPGAKTENGRLEGISRIEAVKGYLNLYFDTGEYACRVVETVLEQKDRFGAGPATGEQVMVEFSQPNTHKAFHVGHLRYLQGAKAEADLKGPPTTAYTARKLTTYSAISSGRRLAFASRLSGAPGVHQGVSEVRVGLREARRDPQRLEVMGDGFVLSSALVERQGGRRRQRGTRRVPWRRTVRRSSFAGCLPACGPPRSRVRPDAPRGERRCDGF